jgi:hypothetical protein
MEGFHRYQEFKQYPEPRMDGFHHYHSEIGAVINRESSCHKDSSFKKIDQEGSGIKKIGMLVDPSTEMTKMLVGSSTKMLWAYHGSSPEVWIYHESLSASRHKWVT